MKFKNAKMTEVPSKNPFPNTIVASDAAVTYAPFVVKKNKGAGPKGQTSNMQIKKVKFTGVKQLVETIPNFLHPELHALLHKKTCEEFLSGDPEPLSYNYQPGVTHLRDGFFFFCHILLNKESYYVSKFYHDIGGPILGRLNYNFIHRMKVNLYTNTGRQDQHNFHTDMPIDHKILLYCLNTNNGYTELEDGSKMPSIANQAYIFNGNIKHRSVSQTNSHIRVNVNVVFT